MSTLSIQTRYPTHSNFNADPNTKTLNYSKVQFKPLINFELTVLELTVIFKHEMIGFLPKFQRNFELSGTSN